ncbi:hypothetical protein WDW89_10185, partial [Deltaproteobacteria bacterium TL4]
FLIARVLIRFLMRLQARQQPQSLSAIAPTPPRKTYIAHKEKTKITKPYIDQWHFLFFKFAIFKLNESLFK